MKNEKMINKLAGELEDVELESATGGYTSTDHYTTNPLPSPLTCSECGGLVYSSTVNTFGPHRQLKAVIYHCSGNGTWRSAHDVVVNYM